MRFFSFLVIFAVGLTRSAEGQTANQAPPRLTLPPVTVTAQKEPADRQKVPLSVTAVPLDTLWDAKLTSVGDAAIYLPNTWFNEFSARKLSNAFMRGVGSSPSNPGVTTYLDGVPQLNANSSNIEFTGVEQVEFVRGPQSALFGRNTLGGVINIASERPSVAGWSGRVGALRHICHARGPRLGVGTDQPACGSRVFGRPIGSRRLHGQHADRPRPRLALCHLRQGAAAVDSEPGLRNARDRLGRARARRRLCAERSGEPAAHAVPGGARFRGQASRDLVNTTIATRYEGRRVALSTTTGLVNWKTQDETDLDYSPLPAATRTNDEEDVQFTQEVRLASAAGAPLTLSPELSVKWQAGVFYFVQHYDQNAVNRLAPFVLSPSLPFAIEQTSPRAALDDRGLGVYGQGTLTVRQRLDVTVGARFDHERKDAFLETFLTPALVPGTTVDRAADFSNVSPQLSVAYRWQTNRMVYTSAGRGFKAGGFNPASPLGREAFTEEHTWNVEGGVKSTWAGGRLVANASAFVIDWSDLQLNLPNPFVPAQFYIANVGGARSRGAELEVTARPREHIDLFGSLGYTRATFSDGTVSSGLDVSGNRLPNTPDFTFTVGMQVAQPLTDRVTVYGRAEVAAYGAFFYDDLNRASQASYSLANLRAGARGGRLFAEAWVKNAFDTHYIPLAFPYSTQSGFIGESGRPRTLGVSAGLAWN